MIKNIAVYGNIKKYIGFLNKLYRGFFFLFDLLFNQIIVIKLLGFNMRYNVCTYRIYIRNIFTNEVQTSMYILTYCYNCFSKQLLFFIFFRSADYKIIVNIYIRYKSFIIFIHRSCRNSFTSFSTELWNNWETLLTDDTLVDKMENCYYHNLESCIPLIINNKKETHSHSYLFLNKMNK